MTREEQQLAVDAIAIRAGKETLDGNLHFDTMDEYEAWVKGT